MPLPKTPFFLAWFSAVAVAALYLFVRLFFGGYERVDYGLMVFVHGSLVAQYVVGWSRRGAGEATPEASGARG
jgi:hypothetical protein